MTIEAMSEIASTTLDNGVRILTEPVGHVGSASVGLWCKTGSAHEHDDEAGITHFIEHMLFKGTKTRTAKQIAEEIEGRGGILNAFTDKEKTCYYCRVLDTDVENAIDVLSEMVTASLLDKDDLELEKGVVIEEIRRSEDEPGDHVHELHMQKRWPQHVLGKPIIGTPESVGSFGPDDLRKYMARRYKGGQILLSVAGNVDPDRVLKAAQERLGAIEPGNEKIEFKEPKGEPGKNEIKKDVEQVHFCIGGDGCSYYNDDLYVATVLDHLLGGGMSSRLFQEIREKRGLAYAIGSYSLTFTAGGSFTVYGGTNPKNWEEIQMIVRQEFDKFIAEGAEKDELVRAKRSLAGSIVLGLEAMSVRMMRIARNEIVFGRQIPVEEVLEKINAVTNEDLMRYGKTCLDESRISTTAIGPFE